MPTDLSSPPDLVLASSSPARAALLLAAGIAVAVRPARLDEDALRAALRAEGATPRDMADALAEMKARRVAEKDPAARVLGCDQVLELDGKDFGKATDRDEAASQLRELAGRTHVLWSAAVLYEAARPVWRHVGEARLTLRPLSDAAIAAYLDRSWPDVADSVGCYKLEGEGVRLMTRIEGDHFTILGLPLLPLAGYLIDRGVVPA
jgi:septum formation protein